MTGTACPVTFSVDYADREGYALTLVTERLSAVPALGLGAADRGD